MRRRAGMYNRKIAIRRRVPTPDEAGGLDTAIDDLLCVRMAYMKSGVGRERSISGQVPQQQAENVTTFYLPYDSVAAQAEPDGTISHDNRVFQIAYVEDIDEAHEELAIGCTERIQ